jgi:ATP-dependent Lon protease
LKPESLEKYLGPTKFEDDPVRLRPEVGVALGLAYTSYGGDVLEIECVSFPNGKGLVAHTGSLGDVMTESCRIAHSCLRAQMGSLALKSEMFQKQDLHIHFPAGAVPKDGPSAGITIACAMFSRLTGLRMKARTAMTGEITLTGEVLAVGGIREKVLAAKSRGVKTLLLPSRNRNDVSQMDTEWTRGLTFHYVNQLADVIELVFPRRGKN